MLSKLKRLFPKKQKEEVLIANDNIYLFGRSGQKYEIPLNEIERVYLTQLDKLTFFDEYIVLVGQKNEYYISSFHKGYDTILDDLTNLGFDIDPMWKKVLWELKMDEVVTIFERK